MSNFLEIKQLQNSYYDCQRCKVNVLPTLVDLQEKTFFCIIRSNKIVDNNFSNQS